MVHKAETDTQRFERYKDTLLAIISQYLPDCTVYLFGSRARHNARPGSDIDLALDTGNKIDYKTLYKIKDDIEESAIPLFVDIVDLHDVGEDFKNFIAKDLIIWKN